MGLQGDQQCLVCALQAFSWKNLALLASAMLSSGCNCDAHMALSELFIQMHCLQGTGCPVPFKRRLTCWVCKQLIAALCVYDKGTQKSACPGCAALHGCAAEPDMIWHPTIDVSPQHVQHVLQSLRWMLTHPEMWPKAAFAQVFCLHQCSLLDGCISRLGAPPQQTLFMH
jgi:hypothetical protein